MKHTGLFKTFLSDVVDLNATRLDQLEASVDAIKSFIRSSDWEPGIKGFISQGSWAHKTIIKPIAGGAFDADIIVRVAAVEGWEAKDYINSLRRIFSASSTYADKVSSFSHCVTITYAGQRKIDIAPLVIGRWHDTSQEVCNRTANAFEDSEPVAYTSWFNQRNGYSGKNSFRKVTRLLKYLRGIKKTFSCPSVLLTTLLGDQITWVDKDMPGFEDVPTALQTVMGRLDDYLQANAVRPFVANPSQPTEDFGKLLSDTGYANFRSFVNKYRGWIDEAIEAEDFDESIAAWQRVFGEEFGKGAVAKMASLVETARVTVGSLLSSAAQHQDAIVDAVRDYGTRILPHWFYNPPHLHQPRWPAATNQIRIYVSAVHVASKTAANGSPVLSGDPVSGTGGLWFDARLWGGAPIGDAFRVEWRVTNTGIAAFAKGQGRGDFYGSDSHARRYESLAWRGVHFVEAFLVRRSDGVLVGQSAPFDVVIE